MPRNDPQPPTEYPGSANLFLGALTLEPQAQVPLAPGFAELQDRVSALLDDYQQGRINNRKLAAELAQAHLTDDAGAEWTLGASTKVWYCRQPGSSWRQAPPPVEQLAALDADAYADELIAEAQAGMVPLDIHDEPGDLEAVPTLPESDSAALSVPPTIPSSAPEPTAATLPSSPATPELTPDGIGGASRYLRSSPAPDGEFLDLSELDDDTSGEVAPVDIFLTETLTPPPDITQPPPGDDGIWSGIDDLDPLDPWAGDSTSS